MEYNITVLTETGFDVKKLNLKDTIELINKELNNEKTLYIDGNPFTEDFITEKDLSKYKKELTILNKLVGG